MSSSNRKAELQWRRQRVLERTAWAMAKAAVRTEWRGRGCVVLEASCSKAADRLRKAADSIGKSMGIDVLVR